MKYILVFVLSISNALALSVEQCVINLNNDIGNATNRSNAQYKFMEKRQELQTLEDDLKKLRSYDSDEAKALLAKQSAVKNEIEQLNSSLRAYDAAFKSRTETGSLKNVLDADRKNSSKAEVAQIANEAKSAVSQIKANPIGDLDKIRADDSFLNLGNKLRFDPEYQAEAEKLFNASAETKYFKLKNDPNRTSLSQSRLDYIEQDMIDGYVISNEPRKALYSIIDINQNIEKLTPDKIVAKLQEAKKVAQNQMQSEIEFGSSLNTKKYEAFIKEVDNYITSSGGNYTSIDQRNQIFQELSREYGQ